MARMSDCLFVLSALIKVCSPYVGSLLSSEQCLKHGIRDNVNVALKNVVYVVSSNARKDGLNWSLKAIFANYSFFFST